MKNVILHIGMHKTGSTAIQKSLHGYDDGVTRYARFDHTNHSLAMSTIFSRDRFKYHLWRESGADLRTIEERRERYLRELDDELSDPSRENVVISGESVSVLAADEKLELIEHIESRGCALQVVCFVRRAEALAPSSIQQGIKGGLDQVQEYSLGYEQAIEPFRERLPRNQLVVRDYDEAVSETGGDIVAAFARMAGLSDVESKRANTSLSEPAIKLLYRFNQLPVLAVGSMERTVARGALREALAAAYPLEGGAPRLDKAIFSHAVGDAVHEQYAYLRDVHGIDFTWSGTQFDLGLVEGYLTDLRTVDREPLIRMLDGSDIADWSDATFDELLAEAYLSTCLPKVRSKVRRDYRRLSNRMARMRRKVARRLVRYWGSEASRA